MLAAPLDARPDHGSVVDPFSCSIHERGAPSAPLVFVAVWGARQRNVCGVTTVTIFGGSRVEPASEEYVAAEQLGCALAQRGLAVVTGGYHGTMEAVSRGAKAVGGHVIGVTVDVIASNFERLPNAFLDQEVRTAALLERIDKLVELGDAYVVLPGGAGTLAELGIVWNLALLGALQDKPIVVVGAGWQRVFQAMVQELHTIDHDLSFLRFAGDVDEAVRLLCKSLSLD
jgi:uncharacterized protein (TIGR00730 family)